MMTQGTGERERETEEKRRRESRFMPVVRDALGVISVSVVEMCLW